MGYRSHRAGLLAGLFIAFTLSAAALAEGPPGPRLYVETREDPPAAAAAADDPAARSTGMRARRGAFVSVQVNVDGAGQNIVGDAANEPSIAIDPLDPDRIVIGWRQFDSIASNFRQAGWAFSHDGGQSWTFPGVIEPGRFRSDPVLDTDSLGTFYYNSLTDDFSMDVFRSLDSGQSWPLAAEAFGGDKNWMAIDKSGGIGEGHVYGSWQRNFGCCGTELFTRSTDGAASFELPVPVVNSPSFGTSAVGPDGTVYVSGVKDADLVNYAVSRSTNAQDAGSTPSFNGVIVEMGGSMGFGFGPNPGGLLGQANVVVDSSGGPTDGNVYLLGSVNPSGSDPLDVHFARSTDGGVTWTPPVRVNDDPMASGAYQWFGTLSVAPNGRLDAVWNDNRNSGETNITELFYAYSWDAGDTWLGQQPVSPSFDSFVGWPNQSKLGDYYTMISDASGGSLAWAATFNGEQDVYFLRVFPDCNANGVSDVDDIAGGGSSDVDGNHIPDECEDGLLLSGPDPGLPGQINTLTAGGAGAGARIAFLRAAAAGTSQAPGCPGVTLGLSNPARIGVDRADAGGVAEISTRIPGGASGRTVLFQAFDRDACVVSNVISFEFP